jgi:hypothetical protein
VNVAVAPRIIGLLVGWPVIVGKAVTVTVTSLETIADPHVGVTVHTIYQVPAPKPAPDGVYVEAETPNEVIAPPVVERLPHAYVNVPPPVPAAVN